MFSGGIETSAMKRVTNTPIPRTKKKSNANFLNHIAVVYLGAYQTTKMKCFAKIVDCF